jgi:hypothetical protein
MKQGVYRVEWQEPNSLWREIMTPGKGWPYRTRSLARAMDLARSVREARDRPVRVRNSLGGTVAVLADEAPQ